MGQLFGIRVGLVGESHEEDSGMTDFEKISSDKTHVRLRHHDGHEYEFGFLRPDGSEWHEPHLVWHAQGGGGTGMGLAGQYLEAARTWATAVHIGEAQPPAWR